MKYFSIFAIVATLIGFFPLAAAEPTPLEVLKALHEKSLKARFGTNWREVLENLRVRNEKKPPRPTKRYPYEKTELPASLTNIPKWDFDTADFNREIMARIDANRGESIARSEDPDLENMFPRNPTIRWVNAVNERFAAERLDAAKYPRCDDLIKDDFDAEKLKSGVVTVKCWHLCHDPDADLYLAVAAMFDGAWQMRDYRFLGKLKGEDLCEIIRFDELPSAEIARTVYGVYQGIPEAYNNLAIIALKDYMHYKEDDVEEWFRIAAETCPAARRNLYRLYLNSGQENKARELCK